MKDICGVTTTGGTGIVWTCVKKVHAQMYVRKTSSRGHPRGEVVMNPTSSADAHYFRPKYPNRGEI